MAMMENRLFSLPGVDAQIKSLQKQLDASFQILDHILIQGPRGVGKSYFIQTIKKHFWLYNDLVEEIDSESISQDQFTDWLQCDSSENRILIFKSFEKFPLEYYRNLSLLMKKFRVVVSTNDPGKISEEFNDRFRIRVEVPPLYTRRDDILYFIAQEYPSLSLTNVNLLRLYAYHWPGNLRELSRAVQQLFADQELPTDIDNKVPKEKLHKLFLILYENGLQEPDLSLTHNTCFSHVIPIADEYMFYSEPVKLKFINNDISCGFNSCDLKAFVDPDFSNICLEGKEIKWILKSFFQLMYGGDVVLRNKNILDLKPFTEKSSAIIDQAKEDVIHWKLGDSYSNDYDFCSCYFQHFSSSLKQGEINAAVSYLTACATSCLSVTENTYSDESELITIKKATKEYQLDNHDLLRMAGKEADDLDLLVYVKHKDIFGAVDLPDTSAEPGCYLAIPSYYATRFIETGEAHIDTFVMSKTHFPRAGLVMMQQIAVESRDRTIKTREPYYISINQDKIWVVRQQVEKYFKKTLENSTSQVIPGIPSDESQAKRIDLVAPEEEPIEGYRKIAHTLGVSERLAKNFAKIKGFPIHKTITGRVYVYPSELRVWKERYDFDKEKRRRDRDRKRQQKNAR